MTTAIKEKKQTIDEVAGRYKSDARGDVAESLGWDAKENLEKFDEVLEKDERELLYRK